MSYGLGAVDCVCACMRLLKTWEYVRSVRFTVWCRMCFCLCLLFLCVFVDRRECALCL